MSDPRNDFLFPRDSTGTRGAVKTTTDGTTFYVPTVIHGQDGSTPISESNPLPTSILTLSEAFSGSSSTTKTFTKSMFGFVIKNKSTTNSLTFTINGESIEVESGESFQENFEPFTEVSIVAFGAFKAYGLTYPNLTNIVVTEPTVPDTTAPNDVTGLTVGNLGYNSLTLSWTASNSSDVAGYRVYNGSTLIGSPTGVSFNVTGLSASTAYTFTVKAIDASSNLSTGVSVNPTTTAVPADTTPPANVASVSTSNMAQTSVTLTFPASSSGDVSGYDIYNGSTFITTVTVLTYNVTGLTASTQYTFWVKARDSAGNVATGTSTTFTTSSAADTTTPNPVTGLSAGTPTITTVPLSWTLSSSGDVATQEVAYSTDGTNFTVASAAVSSSATSYTVTGLTVSTAYTFRVIAVDAANNRSTATTTTATTTAAQTTYVSDDFNRADAASLGTATTGQTWTNGSLQIISNQVGTTTALTGNAAWNVIDSTHADNIEITLDATFPAAGWSTIATGIVFRFANGGAMYCFGAKSDTSIGIYQAGGSTPPANVTVPSMAGTTKTFKVKIVGQTVECYMDNVLKMTLTDTLLTANTKHGIGIYNSANSVKFDNFSVKSV